MTRLRVVNLLDEKPVQDDASDHFHRPWYNNLAYSGAGIGHNGSIQVEYTWQ